MLYIWQRGGECKRVLSAFKLYITLTSISPWYDGNTQVCEDDGAVYSIKCSKCLLVDNSSSPNLSIPLSNSPSSLMRTFVVFAWKQSKKTETDGWFIFKFLKLYLFYDYKTSTCTYNLYQSGSFAAMFGFVYYLCTRKPEYLEEIHLSALLTAWHLTAMPGIELESQRCEGSAIPLRQSDREDLNKVNALRYQLIG